MNLHKNRSQHLLLFSLFVATAWLSAACRNEAAAAFPTSTPIPVYTPWAAQGSGEQLAAPPATSAPAATLAPAATAAPTDTPEPAATVAPTATSEPAATVEPTATSEPTNTPEPTATTAPAATAAPTSTSAEAPGGSAEALPPEVVALLPTADAANGEQLTVANGCIACHSLQEGVVMVGPSWHIVGATAGTRVDGESAEAYLYQSIVSPNAHVVEGFQPSLMPPTYRDTLTASQLADILAYLLNLK